MLEIEYINLDDIIEADENPKDHDLGVLYESMKRFGFTDPIMLNEASGKLLAGHGRLQALKLFKDRGEKAPDRIQVEKDIEDETIEDWFIPVIKGINIENSADAQAYLIADNRITEIGGWKPMELIESLNEVIEETGNLDGTGYDLDDIETILRDIERDSFSVDGEDTTVSAETLDEETEVSISVGRYKFKVPSEDFYDWEEMVKSSSGAQDVVGITLWIKENLGLN